MNLARPILLASTSPRRQFLMREAGLEFDTTKPDEDESFPSSMPAELVPKFLAEKKVLSVKSNVVNEIVIASDTVVILDDKILNKPADRAEAIHMLSSLSGRTHLVITAVCMKSGSKIDLFDERTEVTFKMLETGDITFYVDHFKPYDKAGAYGAQEFLPAGMNPCSEEELSFLKRINKLDLIERSIHEGDIRGIVGIDKIKGSFFNVMGFPIHNVYTHLLQF